MLVSDVETRVKRQFGDEVGAQITDVDVLRWCNDACKEIALQNRLLQTISAGTTTIGQQDYPFPDDLLSLRAVRYGKLRLTMITVDDIDEVIQDRTDTQGIPQYYWTYSTVISLWPTPDTVEDLTIYYTLAPVEMITMADIIALPPQYDNRIVEYCIAQAAELDDDLEHYQLKMAQFQSGIDSTKGELEESAQDETYPYITYQEEYYG